MPKIRHEIRKQEETQTAGLDRTDGPKARQATRKRRDSLAANWTEVKHKQHRRS